MEGFTEEVIYELKCEYLKQNCKVNNQIIRHLHTANTIWKNFFKIDDYFYKISFLNSHFIIKLMIVLSDFLYDKNI